MFAFTQVIEVTKGAKVRFGGGEDEMQPIKSYTVERRGPNRRAASAGELAFSGSELLLSVGVFLALISLSIWVLVHYCVFAK